MDDFDSGKLEQLVALMRRLGVKRAGSVELFPEMVPGAPVLSPEADLEALAGKEPPPEDLLVWSVTGPLPSELADASKPPVE